MNYYQEFPEKVLEELRTTESGLSHQEAGDRLAKYGPNKLAEGKKVTLLQRFIQQLCDPMIIILLVAAAVSGVTAAYSGESFTDVFIILIVVLINAILGVYQESKAEKAIEALQEMTAATSKVLRDGKMSLLRSDVLVPGDIVILEAGDAVPADCRILESASIKAEEAALTGESVPVEKDVNAIVTDDEVPLGDRHCMLYMGSTVVYGRGRAVVCSTGMDTEMGKIADALAQAEEGETPLQRKLGQLSKILSVLVLGICVFIFLFSLLRAGDFHLDTIISTFMVAVSLAVAAIPEGLAAVVTIVLSIGVTNMSKRNAVIRRLTAVETLGCAQVICSDKTGTLTQNKMTVVDHFGNPLKTARAMSLCSDAAPDETGNAVGEPTECALVNWATKEGLGKSAMERETPRVGEAPFDSGRKMMSTIHKLEKGYVQYTKGAPDELLKRCTHYEKDGQILPLDEKAKAEILAQNKAMADQALRVLAAAERRYDEMPQDQSPAALEHDLTFLGLAGMIDPIRPEVTAAIAESKTAGIRAVMITGDHRDTAVAIAKQLGILEHDDQAITGAQLNQISDEELDKTIDHYSVYARVQPEHKVRIVNAWKKRGCITAMTGDGVNDAPSIKSADIGVGMGITGTDVTKNVAHPVPAGLQHERGAQRLYRHPAGLRHSGARPPAVDQPDYRLLPRSGPGHGEGGARSDAASPPEGQRRNLCQRPGLRRGLSGRHGHRPGAGGLLHRPLHGVRRVGDHPERRRHDHGLPDHGHGRDLPQLQHALPAGQRVQAPQPQQGPLGRHAPEPGAHHRGDLPARHLRRLRLHPHRPCGVRRGPDPGGPGHPHCGVRQGRSALHAQAISSLQVLT